MHSDNVERPAGTAGGTDPTGWTDGSWAGWGDPARRTGLPGHARAWLRRTLGEGVERQPVPVEQARVRPSALSEPACTALVEVVGAGQVSTDDEVRARHGGGMSYTDLLRRRAGDADAPDVVVRPGDADEVAAVLAVCVEHRLAVVPLGGGTSVVGGLAPIRGDLQAVVSLDLARLSGLVRLDAVDRTATFLPGTRAPEAERLLAPHGLTLGHFPQSWERASIGGFVVTRSSGQSSAGYGRLDANVVGLRLATPAGEWVLPALPPNAAGPDLRALAVGSEGVFGVLTEVTLRVHEAPAETRYTGWAFRSLADGAAALRTLAQHGPRPTVARLSDVSETTANLALSGGMKSAALRAYLATRRYGNGCMAIIGVEGRPDEVAARQAGITAVLKHAGGLSLGSPVGDAWAHGRFAAPYLRDDLMDAGYLVETLETATSWSRLADLHTAVGAALTSALTEWGTPPVVLCHLSHIYHEGASLYFTVLARAYPDDPVGQWAAAKAAASRTLVSAGATITHHHAVGADHAPYLPSQVGEVGIAVLRAVKDTLDPTGVLNPGKLLP